jgi:hypothetical protein
MLSSQVEKPPREASKRLASRQTARKTSCTTSCASCSSVRIRRARP